VRAAVEAETGLAPKKRYLLLLLAAGAGGLALALRRRRPEAFAGAYEPLAAAEGTCAFRRGGDVVVGVAVRGAGPELELPPGRWRNVLEGVERALPGYRVSLLERAS
jgi:hypothetical protein